MTAEHWTRLTELFEAALDREPAERAGFLSVACAGDDGLRREVELLIDSHERAGDFGTSPAFHFAAAGVSLSDSATAFEATLTPGARLGRYEVVALLGSGGMGEVYRARDPQLGRDVGVKILRRRGEITRDKLDRFEREARAVGALHHPNILAVYDIGVADGTPYVVSELLEGETLRARLARGPLSMDEAAGVARQIVSGLSAAHDKGIIHRDLKPENLFITSEGIVKILDFGLAKQTMGGADSAVDLTERGLVMGTAGYMAPEQVSGDKADARSDLFAFGAVLYEMLTGQRAFTGDSVVDTMDAVLTADPAAVDSLPPAFGTIVQRCLAKDPARRFASAHDVDAALTSMTASQQAAPRAAFASRDASKLRRARRRLAYMSYAVAAVLVVAAALAAALIVQRRQAPPGPGAAGRPALAVLPFEDRSADPAATWLSTGIASMLVTSLAQTPGLDVIGTERLDASFRELGRASSDRSASVEAARHAGAGAVLVGTVFKVGSDVRVDVQVQDVETGRVVFARSEQGPDLFGLVDVVASDVRGALAVANRPAGRPLRDVTTTSLEAYALYAKAQEARHNNRSSDARTLFEEALRVDPAFTLARAQLVTMLDRLGESAAAMTERQVVAGQLDRLPERQRLLAEAIEVYDTNPSRAVALLEQLLARYPDDEEAYDSIVHAYTHSRDPAYWQKTLAFMQRWARAIPGPGSGHFHNHFGYAYIEHGLFTEAEREFRAYIRVSPDEANAYDSLAELFLMTGRPAMAIETYDQALRLNPLFGWSHFGRAYALAVLGRYDEAFAGLTKLQDLGSRAGVPAAMIHMADALFSSRLGRYADAASHLETAHGVARTLGDTGAQADADLFEATLAVERGRYARAVEYADRAARSGTGDQGIEIMRARRMALAHLIAGIAETRSRRIDAARGREAALRKLDVSGDAIQVSWQHALAGEIALAEDRLDDADKAFRAAEYQIASSFAIYPALVALANNLPFRDGLARTAIARGDRTRARDVYRRLNQPDASSTWDSVFDPRYARAAAQLAARPPVDLAASRSTTR